jgi:hypothetical protein
MTQCVGVGSAFISNGQSKLLVECRECGRHHAPPEPAQAHLAGLEADVRAELARPGNERVFAVIHDDGSVESFLRPTPAYVPPMDELTAAKRRARR